MSDLAPTVRDVRMRPAVVPMRRALRTRVDTVAPVDLYRKVSKGLSLLGHRGFAVLAEPLRVESGLVPIPNRAGTVIAWNEDAVARYAVEL
jgi:L-alanine-DL-glutamate epimerase-like enolase superfamily enzyme